MTGLSIPYIYKMMKKDEFPKSVKLTSRTVGWCENEVVKWQEVRKQSRNYSQWAV